MQRLTGPDGSVSYTILLSDGSVHEGADAFLRQYEGSGTQRTYAYFLVDHLRWCARERLAADRATLRDLLRYMGAVGAQIPMPWGQPWRLPPKRPYGAAALKGAAACIKGYYLHVCTGGGTNAELRAALAVQRLPTRVDRGRSFLGHTLKSMPSNPLTPSGQLMRRHPKMLPEGSGPSLLEQVNTARDAMVVQWLSDTAMRIGGLTGLHLVDLHLRRGAGCGECVDPHVHVCHRWNNPNEAAAKIKPAWQMTDGVISGGEIYRASPAMINRYFRYITTEYSQLAPLHGMLLIQLAGARRGEPWTADAARGMLRRAGRRAGLPGRIKPQAFRHQLTNDVLDVSGDPMVAKLVGNWASAQMVDEVYGHPDLHSPQFTAALEDVWGERG